MVHFGEFLKTLNLQSNSVTRQVNFNWTKMGGKCHMSKSQMRHSVEFSNTVPSHCASDQYQINDPVIHPGVRS